MRMDRRKEILVGSQIFSLSLHHPVRARLPVTVLARDRGLTFYPAGKSLAEMNLNITSSTYKFTVGL